MKDAERGLLRLLAEAPLLDRLEAAALSGWSRGLVYRTMQALRDRGLVEGLRHATEHIASTVRYSPTTPGLRVLAQEEGATLDDLLRRCPVSEQWRRILLHRLDGAAAIYRLAAALANIAFPLRFHWRRTTPADAYAVLPDGSVVAVLRQGRTSDRTGFALRLRRLMQGLRPSGALLLMPDETRLRHARRLLERAPFPTALALERDAIDASPDAPIWRLPAARGSAGLETVLGRMPPGGVLPAERHFAQLALPQGLPQVPDGEDAPGFLLPALLRPAQKRALDVIADWPWIGRDGLAALLGVSRPRASQLMARLEQLDLALRSGGRLVPSDRGLALIARRDRASVGAAWRRWSAGTADLRNWRDVPGSRSRQLLRNAEHTAAVHGFIAVLSRQAPRLGWTVEQLDPPQRASRYFRASGALRSVHPDAFGMLRRDGAVWAWFLEWERRAVRPRTMAARLAPYLRYYAAGRPIDDHGVRPFVLVVFEDEIAAAQFLRVAAQELAQARVDLPLLVSHARLLARHGPLGRAWLAPGGDGGPMRALSA